MTLFQIVSQKHLFNSQNSFFSKFVAFSLILWLLLPSPSKADTLNVPADHGTIQAAIDAAADGDTVLVAPGTYTEILILGGKDIILESSSRAGITILDGNDSNTILTINSGVTENTIVRGFVFQNARGSLKTAIDINFSSPVIDNNIFRNNESISGLAMSLQSSNSRIINNIFEDNISCCGSGSSGGVIQVIGGAPVIESNIFRNNVLTSGASAINVFSSNGFVVIHNNQFMGNSTSSGCGTINMLNPSSFIITQNIFSNNSGNASGGICLSNTTTADIINNTFYNNQAATISSTHGSDMVFTMSSPSTINIHNNISYNNSSNASISCLNTSAPVFSHNNVVNLTGLEFTGNCANENGINNNISQDPLFIDPSNLDFHLNNLSPSIDAGSNTIPNLPTYDIENTPRIIDGNNDLTDTIDIGAFEFSPNGILKFEDDSFTVQEDGTNAVINICRTSGSVGSVSTNYITSDGTGINGVNYSSASGTVSFSNGEGGCKAIQIPILDNNLKGNSVNFNVSLSNPTGGALLSNINQTAITIVDNENMLSLSTTTNKNRYSPSENIILTLTVANDSTASNAATAQNVSLTNVLPSELIFSSVQTSQGNCSGTQTLNCNLGSIGLGNSATITITASSTTTGTFDDIVSVSADPINQAPISLQTTQPVSVGFPTAEEYFPIVPLTTYTYREEGTPPLIETDIILPGTVNINGVETTVIIDEDGDAEYITIDNGGYRIHRYDYANGDSVQFFPSIKVLNAQPAIGDSYSTSGTATYTIAGVGTANVSYNWSCTVPAVDTITTLLGTYDALRIDCDLNISGSILGVFIQSNASASSWIVEGLGDIREVGTGTNKINGAIVETINSTEELQSITPPPEITSPTPGALGSGTVTVNWNQNPIASKWLVTAGSGTSSRSAYDIALPPELTGSATSYTLSGLPTDGSSFYINLYALVGNTWYIVDSVNVTAFDTPGPEITSPTAGSTLTAGSVNVTWDAMGTAATGWLVTAGSGTSSRSAYDIALPPELTGSATSYTLSGLPTDSRSFYINLYALVGGKWSIVDSVNVTAFEAPPPAAPEITSPTAGSTLTAGSVNVTWDAMGTAATGWLVTAGSGTSSRSAYDIALPPELTGSATSYTLSGLPTDSRSFYINLYALVGGKWSIVDSVNVTAFEAPPPAAPEITSPTAGSTLTAGSVNVTWDAMGTAATGWLVTAGSGTSSRSAYDIALPPELTGSATSYTLSGLPTDSRSFYINLYALVGGKWSIVDSVNVTAFEAPPPAAPEITSPTAGSTLTAGSVNVTWDAMGTAATGWLVTAGSGTSSRSAYDIALPPELTGSATSYTLSGLPTDSRSFYINLYALVGGKWSIVDSVNVTAFEAPPPAAPEITSPTAGSTLTAGSVNVTWDAMGTAATGWLVTAGSGTSSRSAYDIALPPELTGSATSYTLSGLPTDSRSFYINLYALVGGKWSIVDSVNVTAFEAPPPAAPEITSPTAGSTLTAGSVNVTWDAMGTAATGWLVTAGSGTSSRSAYDIALPPELTGSATSYTLSGLPTDSRSFYINLYALVGGKWSIVDSISINATKWISGTFNVSGTFNYSGCQTPGLNGANSFTGTYRSNARDGSTYSGSLSLTTLNGVNLASQGLAVNGSFSGSHAQTNANGSYTIDAIEQGVLASRNLGTFSGNLSGNSISVNLSGNDVIGETCFLNASFSGSRQ